MFHKSSYCESAGCVEVQFVKSSHSDAEGCVEVQFVKSTYSSNNNGCVEAAISATGVRVRDSKDQSGPVLTFTPHEWAAFLAGVKDGEFELINN